MNWTISEMYGCLVAESSFGFTIWAKTYDELKALFINTKSKT